MNLWIWLFLTILHKCYSTTTILYKKSHIPKKLHLQKKRRNLFSSTYTLQHIKMKDLTFANLHGRNSRNPCLSNTFALIINASLKTFSILFFFHDRFICFTINFQEKKGLNFISIAFPGHLCCKLTLIHLTFISSSIITLCTYTCWRQRKILNWKFTSTPITTVAWFYFQLSTSPVTDTSNSTLLTIKETYLIPFFKLYTQLPVKAMFCHFFHSKFASVDFVHLKPQAINN